MVYWTSLKAIKEFSLDELKDLLVELHHYKEFVLNDGFSKDFYNFHLKILEESYGFNSKNPDLSHCFDISNSKPVNHKGSYLFRFDFEMKVANKHLRDLQTIDSRFNNFEAQYNYEY